ncbi:MAG: ATP-binding cassette domain-containing protein [Bacteroidota bacterium]
MIDVRAITVSYPDRSMPALHGVSLSIPEGSFLALMGANGSGKSTLARCLNGLLLPERGEILVDGAPTADPSARLAVSRTVGMVFQNPHLQITSLTVEREVAFGLQNLRLPAGEVRQRTDAMVATMGLDRSRQASPRSLSAGEQQRLALGGVLAMDPRYLVLDEATSLLSPAARSAILQTVMREREKRGMAIVLITQFAAEALLADRLVVLQAGRVVRDGSARNILGDKDGLTGMGLPVPLQLTV